MKMKPILFNTEMVRAILDGRKSVTRRVVKPQPFSAPKMGKQPYRPGDILYVRETWAKISDLEGIDPYVGHPDGFLHRADWEDGSEFLRWRPSIRMPKEAARLFLRVTDVRVERLQNIDDEGAKAEGVRSYWAYPHDNDVPFVSLNENDKMTYMTRREAFEKLWDSTIKKADLPRYGWNANPWVFVISFDRIEKPQME